MASILALRLIGTESAMASFDVAGRNGGFGTEEGFNDSFEKLCGDRVHFANRGEADSGASDRAISGCVHLA